MRAFLLGSFLGTAASIATAGILYAVDPALRQWVSPLQQILGALLLGFSLAATLWTLSFLRALVARIREVWRKYKARRQRRQQHAADKDYTRARATQGDDAETLLLTNARSKTRLSRSKVTILLEEAEAAHQAGEFQRAADLYSDLLDGAPNNVQAHLARGRVYMDLNDYNRAMSDLVLAEELAPESPAIPLAMGELYFVRKDYARAISYFDIVIGLEPNHAMAFFRRGLCHSYRKNHPVALEDLRQAFKLDPTLPSLQTHLAQTERKVKENAKPKKR